MRLDVPWIANQLLISSWCVQTHATFDFKTVRPDAPYISPRVPVAKKQSTKKPSKPPEFEEALARLEEIVHQLEEGDIRLSDALAGYEEGVGLLRLAHTQLEGAQRRIELLRRADADGSPTVDPFDAEATFDPNE